MKNKKDSISSVTASSILAERKKTRQLLEKYEQLRLETELSETSEEDEIIKKLSFKPDNDVESTDANFTFKNYGHDIFTRPFQRNSLSSQKEETSENHILRQTPLQQFLDSQDWGIDRYLIQEMLNHQLWDEITETFGVKRNLNIAESLFVFMTCSSEYSESCKQYLLSNSVSWMPSYDHTMQAFSNWGVSSECLNLLNASQDHEMDLDVAPELKTQNFSEEEITIITTTLEYLKCCYLKSNPNTEEASKLINVLLRMSTDKRCSGVLPRISCLVEVLLGSLSNFDSFMVNQLACPFLYFKTEIVNKVFVSLNVIPKNSRGQQFGAHVSYLILQDILPIERQTDEMKNFQPILSIFEEHREKMRQLSPANVYFFVLLLTNIHHRLDIKKLNSDEFSQFLDEIFYIKSLPQIGNKNSFSKFISNFVEWCITLWNVAVDEEKEQGIMNSPKKSPRKSPKKKIPAICS